MIGDDTAEEGFIAEWVVMVVTGTEGATDFSIAPPAEVDDSSSLILEAKLLLLLFGEEGCSFSSFIGVVLFVGDRCSWSASEVLLFDILLLLILRIKFDVILKLHYVSKTMHVQLYMYSKLYSTDPCLLRL